MWRPASEDELQLYVDGQLDPTRLPAVDAYLEANPREAERIFEYCRQNGLLRSLGEDIASELPPAGEQRLRRVVTGHQRTRHRTRSAAVAASALVLIAGVAAGFTVLRGAQGAAPNAGTGFANLVAEATGMPATPPDDAQAMSPTLRPLDLSAGGFELVDGRVVSSITGPAMQLHYRDRHGRGVTMLLAETQPPADTGRQVLPVYTWIAGKYTIAVRGLAGQELITFAQAASDALQPAVTAPP